MKEKENKEIKGKKEVKKKNILNINLKVIAFYLL